MPQNVYDQASRYAAKLDPPGFLAWALGTAALTFHGWLDTRRLPFPGAPDRTNDTVADLEDPARPAERWAVPLEFALEPDGELFYRLLLYLGHLGLEERPSQARGDRYRLGAVVVNLTGVGATSQAHQLAGTGVLSRLDVAERNLSREDAAATLVGITTGTVAPVLLPFVPLMQGGDDSGIIQQWIALASAEPDARRRGDYGGLAVVFAEATGRRDLWKQALKGWNMVQSQQVLEWMAEGEARGRAETLLRFLRVRFGPLPSALEVAVRGTTESSRLESWVDVAATAATLTDFRQTAQI